MKRVRSEITSAVHSLPWLIARDEGYFAEEGLEVDLVPSPSRGTWKAAPERGRDTVRGPDLIEDPEMILSVGVHMPFEEGACDVYRGCEWGQLRRARDSRRGGLVMDKRPTITTHAVLVRAGSPIRTLGQLANRKIGVNFHAGSHYVTLVLLEGFLRREEIRLVHAGRPLERYELLLAGEVDAVTLMEPWITLAEKLGCENLGEACYAGMDIATAELGDPTYDAVRRAIRKAARAFNANKKRYLHYLMAEIPAELGRLAPDDFHLPRLRCTDPEAYSEVEFERTVAWMRSWDLIDAGVTYDALVKRQLDAI